MDTKNALPRSKDKKSKDDKRKRAKKSRSSQRILIPGPSVDESMAGDPKLSKTNGLLSDVNHTVMHVANDKIESQSTALAAQDHPTVSRVQAAKDFLNASRHELPHDQDRVTSDKGLEQRRATKKKLANLSLQRESLHNAKPSSSRRSSFSHTPTNRKKTKGSRKSKITCTSAQDPIHDNIDNGQKHQGTSSMPTPNETATTLVHALARTNAECTTSDVSRHERRMAARNELEAISTHIRHRSNSRSLRTRETSTRRQVDMVSALSHAASCHAHSSPLDEDVTSTPMETTKSSTDGALVYQTLSNYVCSHSSSEQPVCLAPKSEHAKQTEYRELGSVSSSENDDEVNSFACSLDSSMSHNTPTESTLQAIQDDMLQIIRMLPPKPASKNQREEKKQTLEIPISHFDTTATTPPSSQSSIVDKDMSLKLPPTPKPGTGHSGGLSSSLHPNTDLQSFLKHVAVLNDLKALTDLSSTSDSAELTYSELINATGPPTKFQRFQRLFQLKCTLFNILRQEASDEAERLRQTLLHHYDIELMDLDFVLEHLALCEQENIAIRWDLVRMIFFPDDENPRNVSHKKPVSRVCHQSLPILGHPSSFLGVSDDKKLWHSNVDFPTWNSLSDSVCMEKSLASSGRGHNDEETEDEQPTSWSPMEEFQEEILELFESVESSMADLPLEQQKERRLVLVQLLQATSEEEAHMTTLSFDDMAEIVRHIRISKKTETDVQWDMIRDIVFPFGVNSIDSFRKREDGEGTRAWGHESSLGNSSILHQSFRSTEHLDDGVLRVFDYSDHAIDITGKLWDMTREDLDVVLEHIQVAIGNRVPIRWDLIGDILFPGDSDRQSIFSDGISSK